jgi:hypothetical protein
MLSSQSGLVSLAEAAVGTYNGSKRNTHTCCQSLHGVQGALLGMPHVDFHLAMWQYHWKLQLRPSLQAERSYSAPNGFSKFHCERETLPSNVEGGLSLAGIRSSHRVHRACLGRRQAQGHHARECESSYTLLECVCACAASACVLMLAVLSASCSTFLLRCSALVRTHLTAGLGRGSFFSSLRACCAASSACAPCS